MAFAEFLLRFHPMSPIPCTWLPCLIFAAARLLTNVNGPKYHLCMFFVDWQVILGRVEGLFSLTCRSSCAHFSLRFACLHRRRCYPRPWADVNHVFYVANHCETSFTLQCGEIRRHFSRTNLSRGGEEMRRWMILDLLGVITALTGVSTLVTATFICMIASSTWLTDYYCGFQPVIAGYDYNNSTLLRLGSYFNNRQSSSSFAVLFPCVSDCEMSLLKCRMSLAHARICSCCGMQLYFPSKMVFFGFSRECGKGAEAPNASQSTTRNYFASKYLSCFPKSYFL